MGIVNPTLAENQRFTTRWVAHALVAACCFVAGLALSRLLYEGLFPTWSWAGRPLPAVALGVIVAVAGAGAVAWAGRRLGASLTLAALPLLLNLFWLLDPAVDVARGRFLFAAGWWLAAVVLAWLLLGDADRRWRWLGPGFVAVALGPVYLLTMSPAVGAADAFEFQVVAPQLGIAHPTGYPLYLLLGKLFSLLPFGTMAWRINLASAVYAVLAAAVVFRLNWRLLRRPPAALAGAVILGLLPVYWNQAIIAEVYTLHAVVVASALLLMLRLIDRRRATTGENARDGGVGDAREIARDRKTMVALAFLLGLGLTNHLTTVFLLPPAALAVLFNLWPSISRKWPTVSRRRSLVPLFLQLLIAFLLPLLLYAYLPLRWAAINGEPMGMSRFVDWVAGGRFQDALQWGAWLRDPTRRQIVARLFVDAWGWSYLLLAAVGAVWLLARRPWAGLVLLVAAAGFSFYALNYYVPDLSVFLIPAHVVVAIWVAAGLAALLDLVAASRDNALSKVVTALLFPIAMLPAILGAGEHWAIVDQSARDGGETWAGGVLSLPLERRAAVLADSEKIAPLYYLQQTARLRPDLDIMVLPDEAAYRAELDARLAAGGAVYLARYLPGLEGVYHLRSAGPLVEVSREPLVDLPPDAIESDLEVGPLRLLGYRVEPLSDVDSDVAITIYWTLDRPIDAGERTPTLYWRWGGGDPVVNGLHPVNDTYPVNAWRPDEVVVDYHRLPLTDVDCAQATCSLDAQVAAAPRFTPAAELEWQTVATLSVMARSGPVGQARRMILNGFALDGLDVPASVRPGTAPSLRFSGYGDAAGMEFLLVPAHAVSSLVIPAGSRPALPVGPPGSLAHSAAVEPPAEEGPHALIAYPQGGLESVCGWLARPTTGCVVAEIDVSGVALPDHATNFDDKVALLDMQVDWANFAPGGQLPVTITWQGLSQMSEDYTVFVQVLDAAERIVGQVDAWPVQGTRPTSDWQPGEVITDPHVVQLSADIPPVQPGDSYEIHVGLYLLATLQRLPTLDAEGNPMGDHVRGRLILD